MKVVMVHDCAFAGFELLREFLRRGLQAYMQPFSNVTSMDVNGHQSRT